MPRKPTIPSYRLHKGSGQGVVTLNNRDHYLGVYNTPASREAYERLIAEWLSANRAPVVDRAPDLTVSEVIDAYWAHAKAYYADAEGNPTSQVSRVRLALGIVRDLYGSTAAGRFGPQALRACRDVMVRRQWCRRVINQRVDCVRRAFKWAAGQELVPGSVYEGLRTLDGLRAGRTQAPDHAPVEPVSEEHLEPVISRLPPFLADVARLQLLTALRPGEALALEWERFDRSREVWLYQPPKHKTAWRGHVRVAFFGPRAQEIVERYLYRRCPRCETCGRAGFLAFRGDLCGPCADSTDDAGICGPWPRIDLPRPGRFLFDPREATGERFLRMRAARKTKVQPSQKDRTKKKPKKAPGERYLVTSYGHAITRACREAGVPCWHAHQLRHNSATRLVAEFDWEVARIILGHKSVDMTRIYALDDVAQAIDAIRKVG